MIATVATHSGPASLLLQHKGGINATPLAGQEKSPPIERHEITGMNIAITALHLLPTALSEHVRREPHICWHTRPDPAPLLNAYKKTVYCHDYPRAVFPVLPLNRQH